MDCNNCELENPCKEDCDACKRLDTKPKMHVGPETKLMFKALHQILQNQILLLADCNIVPRVEDQTKSSIIARKIIDEVL